LLPTRYRRAFTLTECLVVIAIVAVLGAVGFAASGPAREQARQTTCASQMRQLHAAVMQYTIDVDAGEEIPGLGPLAAGARRSTVLTPYVRSRDQFFCPNLPEFYRRRIGRSYIWLPVPYDSIESPSPGELGMLAKQREEIDRLGREFALYRCDIHDQTYYQPREAHSDIALTQPFILEISVSGTVSKGRRPYGRSRILEGWAMLPEVETSGD
jgi:prepilin-type N-terminal cleavage/methylation domain-containing protein